MLRQFDRQVAAPLIFDVRRHVLRPCIIFDLDGTLVDSETASQQALLDLLPDLDCSIDVMLDRYRGMQLDLILDDLAAWAGVHVPGDFVSRYRAHESVLLEENIRPMPGALQMLRVIQYPNCLASGGPMPKIQKSLAAAELDEHFGDRVFSSYTVRSWKPDPGLFLYAAERMGFRPEDCVVVEDSPPGIEAAIRAGMSAIHYTGTCSGPDLPGAEKLENLLDLPSLLELFWGQSRHD